MSNTTTCLSQFFLRIFEKNKDYFPFRCGGDGGGGGCGSLTSDINRSKYICTVVQA